MYNHIYRKGKYPTFLAKDLTEAHKLGFFGRTMHRDEMIDRITKYNPDLIWKANKDYKGLFDSRNGFICGIPHFSSIPEYSIMEYNFGDDRKVEYRNMYGDVTGTEITNQNEFEYKVLARGWQTIFAIVEKRGFKIDRRGL